MEVSCISELERNPIFHPFMTDGETEGRKMIVGSRLRVKPQLSFPSMRSALSSLVE